MKPTITVNTAEWLKAAQDLKRESSRSIVDFLNNQMYYLLQKTIYLTHKSNVNRVEKQMRKVVNERGQILAELLLFKWKAQHGTWPVRGQTHAARTERLIALKRQSSAMIRAGWLAAFNGFRKVSKGYSTTLASIKRFGIENRKLGGWARPARFTLGVITAEAANEALGYEGKEKAWLGAPNPEGAVKVAQEGLQKGMAWQTKDMVKELERRLKKDLAKFGAK